MMFFLDACARRVHPVVAERRREHGCPFLIEAARMDVGLFLFVSQDKFNG
jgi:hypothetical protein